MQVSILGAGNGGFAAAAHLALGGHNVTLYEAPEFESALFEIRASGGIDLETMASTGIVGGFAELENITTDIAEAVRGAEVLFVIVPAFGHRRFAELCAPHLRDGQIVVLAPGNLYGTLEFASIVRQSGNASDVAFAEFDCMMYACRKMDAKSVWLRGYKHNLGCGVFPAIRTDAVLAEINKLYPTYRKRENVLAAGLSNPNGVTHVPLMLFNISNVEAGRDMLFYRECLTLSIAHFIEKLDDERMVFHRNGLFDMQSVSDLDVLWYGHQGVKGNSVVETNTDNPIYPTSKLPTDIGHRYLTEDVPYGLIPMAELLALFGEPHATIDTAVQAACTLCGRDFHREARTLEHVGFRGRTAQELLNYVHHGE